MLKELMERRAELQESMDALLDTAKTEKRALTTEEVEKFDNFEAEIRNIDATIEREEKRSKEEKREVKEEMTIEEREMKDFADYIRCSVAGTEMRAESKLTMGDNGAVIPKTIIKKIMEKVSDISPVYRFATKYNIAGTVNIPKEDGSADSITVAYGTEFTDLESHANKYATIELTGYLYGALTKISKSLLNNSDFDLTNWVINKMAKKVAKFIEGELLNGSTSKVSGVAGSFDKAEMGVTLKSKTAIASDELIDMQDKVPDVYQADAIWVMNKDTRNAIRKLKDGQGNYLLVRDFSTNDGYTLLGRPVHCSDNVDKLGTVSKNVIFYGDFSGLAVKEAEKTEAQVLREKYATQHAIGVVMWGEIDAKVEDTQKIAVATCPSA